MLFGLLQLIKTLFEINNENNILCPSDILKNNITYNPFTLSNLSELSET